MSYDQSTVRNVLAKAKEDRRNSLTSSEAKQVASAYEIATPAEGLATSPDEAATIASEIGLPVVLKIVSPDILHKTDAGGVITDIGDVDNVRASYASILDNAKAHNANARIDGVQVQAQVTGGLEVIVGATTDPVFGKLVAFGLGGTLVEILQDVTFRLAPAESEDAHAMLDDIAGSKILDGVRGESGVDRNALAQTIENVSHLVNDFPEISELDLNPVFASTDGAVAADVRVLLDFEAVPQHHQHAPDEILTAMKRIMEPSAVAVIGASAEDGKIGNSVMRNLIDGGYEGELYPVHPKADQILGHQCYPSIVDIPGNVDIAIFCIPAQFVANVIAECGRKQVAGAILIPSGFAEIGEHELQDEIVKVAREANVRLMGPNIYGFYYTHKNLCATFCTPYNEKGSVALSSQSGGVGMAIIGFSRSAKMGVSAIVGLGNKSDIDEDDLLTYFEQDPNTSVIAMHVEDLKDGRKCRQARVKDEARRRSQGRSYQPWRKSCQFTHGRAGRGRSRV